MGIEIIGGARAGRQAVYSVPWYIRTCCSMPWTAERFKDRVNNYAEYTGTYLCEDEVPELDSRQSRSLELSRS